MSSPTLPFIYGAVVTASVVTVVHGLRIGRMHFGMGALHAAANRADDPRGFWMPALCNGATGAMCLYLLVYPR